MATVPFKVNIKQDVLDDLRNRLRNTRWPDQIPGSGWDYGSNLAYIQELVDYWIHQFDWRAQEAKINRYSQFIAEVDGLDVHYIHERGRGPDPPSPPPGPRLARLHHRVPRLHPTPNRPRSPRRRSQRLLRRGCTFTPRLRFLRHAEEPPAWASTAFPMCSPG